MKFCTNCGFELNSKPNFCPSCGSKLTYIESRSNVTDGGEQIKEVPLNANPQSEIPTEPIGKPKKDERKQNERKMALIIVGVVVLLLIGLVLVLANGDNGAGYSDFSGNSNGVTNSSQDKTLSTEPHTGNENVDGNSPSNISESTPQPDLVTERNIYLRNNWTSFITAKRSKYTYLEIGGISGLSIIVTNNTEYTLDNLTVKVTIKTVNNYTYKTEYLFFENIKPHSRQEQYVTPTNRGRYVEYEITNVYSDRLNFRWDIDDNTGNGSIQDPWKYNN